MATALTLIVATMAAYAFGRLRFRLGRTLFVRRARDDARAGLRGRGDALPGHGRPAPDRHQARPHARLRGDALAARDLAALQPRARDGHRARRRRRWSTAAGAGRRSVRVVVPQMGSAHRRRRRDRRALGVGRVPDPAAADLDRELQARDRADHRVRRQVHDQLPDPRGGRRARAAAARAARAVPQPAHHERDGGLS